MKLTPIACAGAVLALLGCSTPPKLAVQESASTQAASARSPVSLEELELLERTLLFGEEDLEALRSSREVLRPHVGELVGVWYGFVGSNPHLLRYFSDPESGEPDADYLAAVRGRFEAWVLETAAAEHDQDWLDRQHEIGLRHHATKKNVTDGAQAAPIVHLRYLFALAVIPITATLRPFLTRGDHSPEEVEAMHQAWVKAVLLQCILWSQPYVREGEF